MKFKLSLAYHCFWQKYPALLYGLAFLIGCYAALSPHLILLAPLAVLYLPLILILNRELVYRLGLSSLFLITAYLLTITQCPLPSVPPEGIQGKAWVTLSSLRLVNTSFGQRWQLDGELHRFTPGIPESYPSFRQGPVQIMLPWAEGASYPRVDGTYSIRGKLTGNHLGYRFAVKRKEPWTRVADTWSLGEWRFLTKQQFKNRLNQDIPHPVAAAFLTGLVTGDFSHRELISALGRFGLQHIMAISGFHFSIIAAMLSLLLNALLPNKIASWLLIALLCGYLIFLGTGASILRAWVSSVVVIGGQLLHKRPRGLNTLGIALLILLLIDPRYSQSLAFQLSFLATGAILLFFTPLERALQWLFPKRPLSQVVLMHGWDQHGIALLAFFRATLALGLAVHLVMAPFILYTFQKFPLLSLVYNLFFPFLTSLSMLLLLLAFPLHFLCPPLASVIHAINSTYTQWMLSLTLNIPMSIDFTLKVQSIPAEALVIYLSLMGLIGILVTYAMDDQKQEREALTFL